MMTRQARKRQDPNLNFCQRCIHLEETDDVYVAICKQTKDLLNWDSRFCTYETTKACWDLELKEEIN